MITTETALGYQASVRTGGDVWRNLFLIFGNGMDANKMYDGFTLWNYSIAMNGAVATFNANYDGSLTKDSYYLLVKYRYFNTQTGVRSNPSAISAAMQNGTAGGGTDGITVNIPANASVDTQVDRVEVFASILQAASTPEPSNFYLAGDAAYSGSAITFNIGTDPATTQTLLETKHYVMNPHKYFCQAKRRMFGAGTTPFSYGTASVTNASASVTLSQTPLATFVGWWFKVTDYANKYVIASVNTSTKVITLEDESGNSTTYGGTTNATASYVIYRDPTEIQYTNIDEVAHVGLYNRIYSRHEVTGLATLDRNLVIGTTRGVELLTGERRQDFNVELIEENKEILPNTLVSTGKGFCLAMSTNGLEYITQTQATTLVPMKEELTRLELGYKYLYKAAYNPQKEIYLFSAVTDSNTYNNEAFIVNLNLTDANGVPQYFTVTGYNMFYVASVLFNGKWELWSGDNQASCGRVIRLLESSDDADGADDDSSLTLSGTSTTISGDTLTDTAATFDTSTAGFIGLKVRTYNASTGALEDDEFITSNDGTSVTIASNFTSTTGATYEIAGIDFQRKTPMLTFGDGTTQKSLGELTVVHDNANTSTILKNKVYLDGSSTADQSENMTLSEDNFEQSLLSNRGRMIQVEINHHLPRAKFKIKQLSIGVTEW